MDPAATTAVRAVTVPSTTCTRTPPSCGSMRSTRVPCRMSAPRSAASPCSAATAPSASMRAASGWWMALVAVRMPGHRRATASAARRSCGTPAAVSAAATGRSAAASPRSSPPSRVRSWRPASASRSRQPSRAARACRTQPTCGYGSRNSRELPCELPCELPRECPRANRSTRHTDRPARLSRHAADEPPTPPPITTTSTSALIAVVQHRSAVPPQPVSTDRISMTSYGVEPLPTAPPLP